MSIHSTIVPRAYKQLEAFAQHEQLTANTPCADRASSAEVRDFSFTWAHQPYSFSPSILQRELLVFCTHLCTFCARALPLVTLPQIGTSQAPKVCAAERRSRVRTCRILSSPRDGSLRRVPSVDRCVRGYTREALSSAFGRALSQVQALDGRVSDGAGQSLSSSCVG